MRLATVLLATIIPVFAQFDFGTQERCDAATGAATITVSPPAARRLQPVTGAPYSAVETTESVQTLIDGGHLTRSSEMESATWRDSAGRVRSEIHAVPGQRAPCRSVLVEIKDPVGGYLYVLDPVNQIAHRMPMAAAPKPVRASIPRPAQTTSDAPAVTTEQLGTKTMLGVEVTGTQTSMTYPAGSKMGNDRPYVTTDEYWMSPLLGRVVYSKHSDPTGLVSTTELKELSLAEPEPALLEVPATYHVVDESGPFTVTIPSHK